LRLCPVRAAPPAEFCGNFQGGHGRPGCCIVKRAAVRVLCGFRKDPETVWQQELLDELVAYVEFTPEHAGILKELGPFLRPGFGPVVDRFYDAIQRSPRAMAVFTGGAAQIERQKCFLREWLEGLVSGTYDLGYLNVRARIGRAHVRIKLEQRYMFGAMNLVREGLHAQLAATTFPAERRLLAQQAIDKICDLELAIMLETYAEDSTARMRDRERLATLGQLAGFVGHELRNPLAVMETSLHLLKKRLPVGDEHAARHAQRLAEQVALSGAIISDLLELARDKPIVRSPVDVELFARRVIDNFSHEEGAHITLEVAEGLPHAQIDEAQLRHLIVNLLANACQALADQDGERRVVLRMARDEDALTLSVQDNGPGIADEIRHRLFEPLASTKAKGLGLGLALCRRIAEKHGGEIRASKSTMGGARFEARLRHAFEERTV
jgi:two-component system sensor histidine kinase HydH